MTKDKIKRALFNYWFNNCPERLRGYDYRGKGSGWFNDFLDGLTEAVEAELRYKDTPLWKKLEGENDE